MTVAAGQERPAWPQHVEHGRRRRAVHGTGNPVHLEPRYGVGVTSRHQERLGDDRQVLRPATAGPRDPKWSVP